LYEGVRCCTIWVMTTMTVSEARAALPEVLGQPLRDGTADEVRALAGLLARLDLRPVDRATAELATALSSRYRLRAADATHLATAVSIGADRFITNNRRDFGTGITEIDITYPDSLPDPAPPDPAPPDPALADPALADPAMPR
jgi:predicted nucleic acid-binding protein